MTCRCPEPEVASRSGAAYCAKCGDGLPWAKGGRAAYEARRSAERITRDKQIADILFDDYAAEKVGELLTRIDELTSTLRSIATQRNPTKEGKSWYDIYWECVTEAHSKLPESEGQSSEAITSTETSECPARQSGSAGVDPSAERQFKKDGRAKLAVFDDGSRPVRVHETMEFAAAMLDDEKIFSSYIAAELLRLLRQGKNILVITPSPSPQRNVLQQL